MPDDDQERSQFLRPGWIASAAVLAIVLVVGVVAAVVSANRADSSPAPSAAVTTASSVPEAPPPSPAAVAGSVCGLDDVRTPATLTVAPEAIWKYQGTTAYPTSPTYGPIETTQSGVRSCFQRSPEGALFAAANAAVQGSDPAVSEEWGQYVLSQGEYRAPLLDELGSTSASEGRRMNIVGFRILGYDGLTARVDLAIRASAQAETVTLSAVYDLVWQDGDWKINAAVPSPLDVSSVPDVVGYVAWRA